MSTRYTITVTEAQTRTMADALDEVLLVGAGDSVKVGTPKLAGAVVSATVQRHGQGDKVSIVKFRRRKHYLRMKNHRQLFTEIKVTGINAG